MAVICGICKTSLIFREKTAKKFRKAFNKHIEKCTKNIERKNNGIE